MTLNIEAVLISIGKQSSKPYLLFVVCVDVIYDVTTHDIPQQIPTWAANN